MQKRKYAIDWTKKMDAYDKDRNPTSREKDERIYYPKLKDDGTATVVIRFLPSPDTNVDYVKLWSHGYQGDTGAWYFNGCPTTLGGNQECPMCNANREIYNTHDKETAKLMMKSKDGKSSRTRKLSYYSNILVVKDPQNKENEGKVFLFKFGAKIYEKIESKMFPKDADVVTPVMVFDYYEGANFIFKIKKTADGPNYDTSEWASISPVAENDEALEKIINARYPLKPFIDPSQFKSFEELEARYNKVVGNVQKTVAASSSSVASANVTDDVTTESTTATPEQNIFDGNDDAFFESLRTDADGK